MPPRVVAEGGAERARGRALVVSSICAVGVGLAVSLIASAAGDANRVAVGLLVVAAFSLVPPIYRVNGSAEVGSRLFLGLAGCIALFVVPALGGLHSPELAWLIMLPLLASVLSTFRTVAISSVGVIAFASLLAFAHEQGWIAGRLSEGQGAGMARNVVLAVGFQAFVLWARERVVQETGADLESEARARSRQDAADRARASILAAVSHELRTPMTGILGLSELLADSNLDAQQRDWVRTVRQTGTALLTLLDDLLDSARLDTGHLDLKPRPFRPADLAEQVIALFRPRARAMHLGLHLDVATGVPTKMLGDPARIRQILVNLVGNALKFTEDGGVVVRVSQLPGVLVYEVTDTGKGIPADRLADVFEPFVRAEDASTSIGGVGLGLSIARTLVDAMGGEISVHSERGTGTTFEVRLPLEVVDDDTPTTDTSLVPLKRGSQLRVLVAEDNEVNRMVLTAMVKSLGHEVQVVPNGEEVLPAVRTFHPDVILMDMRMPGVDGLEATRRLRGEPQYETLRVLALTANAFEEDRRACYAAGMDGFLAKPVSRAQLKAALEFGNTDAEVGYTRRA